MTPAFDNAWRVQIIRQLASIAYTGAVGRCPRLPRLASARKLAAQSGVALKHIIAEAAGDGTRNR